MSIPIEIPILILNSLGEIFLLLLIGLGLAIIYGMMRVINMAQGEFMMLGAYGAMIIWEAGLGIWAGILFAPLFVGVIGIAIERTVVRPLYGRFLDTLLATWGVSLVLVQVVTVIFGTSRTNPPNPIPGSIEILGLMYSQYRLFLIGVTIALFVITYILFHYTKFGIRARAVMQNAEMSEALGISTERIKMVTFGIGSALAGIAGALIIPIVGVVPTMGIDYCARMWMVVVVGGAEIFMGTLPASIILGVVESNVAYVTTAFFGQVALFLLAIIILRVLPQGLSGYQRRR